LGYLVTVVIVVVVGSILLAVRFVTHELRPEPRRSPLLGRGGAIPGDACVCGGRIGRSGQRSQRFGDLLGCTACNRSWTMDGRRLRRRMLSIADEAPDGSD